MSTLDPKTLVGQLVTERPSRARVFEKYGIDYCCGGQSTLEDTCHKLGISVEEVLQALAESDRQQGETQEVDWSKAGIGELIQHILETHHAFLVREMPRLRDLVDKVAEVHGESHAELRELRQVFYALDGEIEAHMMKEEQVLFPYAQQLEGADSLPEFHCGSLRNPIRVMIYEHENVGEALETMRSLTNDYTLPEDGCNTYRAMLDGLEALETDLHWHVHKENNILFPAILAAEEALALR